VSVFEPHLEVLSTAQRALLDELGALPAGFVLYGGTAIALRLGHRTSLDFDFFSDAPLDRAALRRALGLLRTAEVLDESPDGMTVSVDRGEPVKLSLFGSIDFGRAGMPDRASGSGVVVASLLDLGATKLKVLLQRVEAKDYRDVAALLEAGVRLPEILGAARALFGPTFNPLVARKALAFFEGGDLDGLPAELRAALTRAAVEDVPLADITALSRSLT